MIIALIKGNNFPLKSLSLVFKQINILSLFHWFSSILFRYFLFFRWSISSAVAWVLTHWRSPVSLSFLKIWWASWLTLSRCSSVIKTEFILETRGFNLQLVLVGLSLSLLLNLRILIIMRMLLYHLAVSSCRSHYLIIGTMLWLCLLLIFIWVVSNCVINIFSLHLRSYTWLAIYW
jgi:hypothetical protein